MHVRIESILSHRTNNLYLHEATIAYCASSNSVEKFGERSGVSVTMLKNSAHARSINAPWPSGIESRVAEPRHDNSWMNFVHIAMKTKRHRLNSTCHDGHEQRFQVSRTISTRHDALCELSIIDIAAWGKSRGKNVRPRLNAAINRSRDAMQAKIQRISVYLRVSLRRGQGRPDPVRLKSKPQWNLGTRRTDLAGTRVRPLRK